MHDVSRPNDFERSDADPRLIGALALGVAIFLIGVPFLVLATYSDALSVGILPANLPQPPAPRLQITPKADLDSLHASESDRLSTFGWVDRDQTIARIPIDRAMELLSQRGLAGWPPAIAPSASKKPE